MAEPDLDPERLFRALRLRLRAAEVPAPLRPRILRRLACLLRLDHGRVEALLQEPPAPVEEPHLYEALFELAVRHEALDELDMVLRLGAAEALGVSPAEHGDRVAGLLAVPRPEPPRQRSEAGWGVLRDLMTEDDTPLLGTEHGPSTRCPACAGPVPLRDTETRQEGSRGVRTRHPLRCPRCGARGELERFYSFRLRGNRDQVALGWPGLLGPLATRGTCARAARALLALGALAALAGAPALPSLLPGALLWARARWPDAVLGMVLGALGLAGALQGLARGECLGAWGLALLASGLVLAHAGWARGAGPGGWDPEATGGA